MGIILRELSFLPAQSLVLSVGSSERLNRQKRPAPKIEPRGQGGSYLRSRRRLTRIRVAFGKSFFERSIVPVDVIVKMNDPILSYDNGAIQN